ncbi:DNA repair protein RecN [Adlercreutzia shanghongiae]|uniref:DNA repair protein RecN n=1 Tax=Adlercreutzia shanghongiae TaxID=3111773 RepID=A0ABU6J114_9ACTN|nr:DNA repair protein RecN [Adlercreutzia sp. R22]MEC4295703.1 DNA repair protein RecN [Adlercreutzia sp. R22]
MIDEIQVRDVALIREASLAPSRGLTVLTGETGAGKTALVSAVKLLIGERADSSTVREGAKGAEVRGRLFPADPEADELVVVRKVSADGRSRATINGAMASVSELARAVGPLVELCGQHEYQALLKPAEHGRILDAWADLDAGVASEYRRALEEARTASETLEALRAQASASNAQLEEARFALQQIEAVNPQGGEYEEVRDWLARAEHAEVLARNSHGAADALSGDGGALDALNAAISLIDEAARADEGLAPFATSLRETCFVVEDVARDMAGYCDSIDFDGESLAAAQERMGALTGLMRSFGPTMEAVFERWDAAAALVGLVNDADDRIARAEAALAQAEEALGSAARAYNEAREEASPRLAAAVNEVLGRLEMGTASVVCTVSPLPRASWSAQGSAAVAFAFKPGASVQPRPLARIASGGEISRVMLAVKVALGAKDGTETLIFDEVDAGVGGSTANALAAVLAELAESHQVITITHLAQVAVLADAHYAVTKTGGDAPETLLSPLEGEARVAEVARLLSGTTTETSLAHARELLG